MGRVLTPLLLGLLRLLLRCRNHLIHDVLNGGCYTNAYEKIECSSNDVTTILQTEMPCGLSAPKWRTVRGSTLQTHQNQLPLWTNFKSIRRTICSQTADRPQFNSAKTTRGNDASGQIFKLYCGPSGPPWRTVRSSLCQSTRDDNVSGQIFRLYCGLSALQ